MSKRCFRCGNSNPGRSTTCPHCGTPMRARRSSALFMMSRTGAAASFLIIAAALIVGYLLLASGGSETDSSGAIPESAAVDPLADRGPEPDSFSTPTAGRVIIQDNLGQQVSSQEAAVVSGSWIALPVWACLGGDRWTFYGPHPTSARIENGFWSQSQPVGLWKLSQAVNSEGPELTRWRQGDPLTWKPLSPGGRAQPVRASGTRMEGNFSGFPLSGRLASPGLFMQNGRVVGWTFGGEWDKGFLWQGPDGSKLKSNISVLHFAGVALRDSQESHFKRGLALDPRSAPAERLGTLALGFQYIPALADDNKPPFLRPAFIIRQISDLTRTMLQNGNFHELTEILDEQILVETGDPGLLKSAAQATAKIRGHRMALRFFENVKDPLVRVNPSGRTELDSFHLQLYKSWIQSEIDQSRPYNGWEAFDAGKRAFPDDIELHFLGIELAVAGREWQRAEDLLRERSYPEAFKGRAADLEVIILERKNEEGKITLRYPAGSKLIPIDVLLNKQVMQRFVIDTGATIVSIPSRTVSDLGIQIDDRTPVRLVSTASGYGEAPEVTINLMELKDFRIHGMPALVLDMPGLPDVGLLGQSFLQHFQVEIDSSMGILRLGRR